jgi:serine/threonine-protein kinase
VETLAGRYDLIQRIGTGGMSAVWRGTDRILHRPVAVKLLGPGHHSAELVREARAAARLCHPNVGTVYDVGTATDGTPYLVMEFISGPCLAQRLRIGQLPWRRAVSMCAQLANGLAAVHSAGLVHRDVKPGNVMLAPTGAKLVDFGISAEIGEPQTSPFLVGTPAYLAPERLAGDAAGPPADVYALGLLLYRTLAGALPWEVDSRTDLLRAHLLADPAPLPPVDGLPDEAADLCERCLAKTPSTRPSAEELAGTWTRASSTPRTTRRQDRRPALLGLIRRLGYQNR